MSLDVIWEATEWMMEDTGNNVTGNIQAKCHCYDCLRDLWISVAQKLTTIIEYSEILRMQPRCISTECKMYCVILYNYVFVDRYFNKMYRCVCTCNRVPVHFACNYVGIFRACLSTSLLSGGWAFQGYLFDFACLSAPFNRCWWWETEMKFMFKARTLENGRCSRYGWHGKAM